VISDDIFLIVAKRRRQLPLATIVCFPPPADAWPSGFQERLGASGYARSQRLAGYQLQGIRRAAYGKSRRSHLGLQ
jgi:hypothetical protein